MNDDGEDEPDVGEILEKVEAYVKKYTTSASLAQSIKGLLASSPEQVVRAQQAIAKGSVLFVVGTSILYLLFVLWELTLWFEADPEESFDRATTALLVMEAVWDSLRLVFNAIADIFNSVLIPTYNAGAHYVIEPTILLVIEVFSLVFLRRSWTGVIPNEIDGFDCSTPQGARFCGLYEAYVDEISNSAPGNESSVLSPRTLRRLVELSQSDGLQAEVLLFPEFDISGLTDGLTKFLGTVVVITAPIADVAMSIARVIVSKTAVFVYDAISIAITMVIEVLKFMMESGLLKMILDYGFDYITILVMHWLIPLFFAVLAFIKCVLSLFQPSTWGEQLICADRVCFQGDGAASDLLIFTSVPVVVRQFGIAIEALVNSRTGRRFSPGFALDMGQKVADLFKNMFKSESASACAACLSCKFPELRFVWLLVTVSVSVFSESSFGQFSGNVSATCQDNGTWYELACGPRGAGADVLPFRVWRERFPLGFHEYDESMYEHYAGRFASRAEELRGSPVGEEAKLAAEAWFLRDGVSKTGDDEAAGFLYEACKLMRSTELGADMDFGPSYSTTAGNSIASISGHFLYEACKRFKHRTFSFPARFIHDTRHEIGACSQNPVTCKKEFEHCLGSCSGVDSHHQYFDFHGGLAKAELAEEIIGTDAFEQAEAYCVPQTATIKVTLFEGGDSFRTWAARVRVRSGMTAIDENWCQQSPISCGAVQRVLERSPS